MSDQSTVVFVDTETTGLDSQRHDVWDIALIVDGGEHEWHLLPRLEGADPEALRVSRFVGRTRKPGWVWHDPLEAAEAVADLTAGRHLVGAVPWFDAGFLATFLREYGKVPSWHYHMVDVEALAIGWLSRGSQPLVPPWDSAHLGRLIGVPEPPFRERHTAIGDARWARAMYEAVMEPVLP